MRQFIHTLICQTAFAIFCLVVALVASWGVLGIFYNSVD